MVETLHELEASSRAIPLLATREPDDRHGRTGESPPYPARRALLCEETVRCIGTPCSIPAPRANDARPPRTLIEWLVRDPSCSD